MRGKSTQLSTVGLYKGKHNIWDHLDTGLDDAVANGKLGNGFASRYLFQPRAGLKA